MVSIILDNDLGTTIYYRANKQLVITNIYTCTSTSTCRFMIDKRRATNSEWRISEKELFIYGIVGGAIGGFCAMWVFRHKTSKRQFCVPYTVLFVLNLLVMLTIIIVLIAVPSALG